MIKNNTRETILCKTYEKAGNTLQKARGLMFRESLPSEHGMLFEFSHPRPVSIWMFAMRFPIDIVFLDNERNVIHLVRKARPLSLSWRTWRLYSPPSPASFVLEVPAGRIHKTRTRLGDNLSLGT